MIFISSVRLVRYARSYGAAHLSRVASRESNARFSHRAEPQPRGKKMQHDLLNRNPLVVSMASAIEHAEVAHTGWTAQILASIATLTGVAGGNWKAVEREQITQEVLDRLSDVIALAYAELGESSTLQDLARRSTAGRVKSALKRWGLESCKVSVIYRTSGSKVSQALKFDPQFMGPGENPLTIGVKIAMPEAKAGDPLPDPIMVETDGPEAADKIEREQRQAAEQAAAEQDAEQFTAAVESAAALMLAENGLECFDDDSLIAELKRRGFRVQRNPKTKAAKAAETA